MTGKWDCGFAHWAQTPGGRGYESYLGYLHHANDYWTETLSLGSVEDLFTNHTLGVIRRHDPSEPLFMVHAFHIVHTPLQVPQDYLDKYSFVKNKDHRTYAAMLSDWEGGTRVNAFVSGGFVPPSLRGTAHDGYIHIPADALGLPSVDSINQWPALMKGAAAPRTEIHISERTLINGSYKLLTGSPSGATAAANVLRHKKDCSNGCIYDIFADPFEHNELSESQAEVKAAMIARLAELNQTIFQPDRGQPDQAGCAAAEQSGGFYVPFLPAGNSNSDRDPRRCAGKEKVAVGPGYAADLFQSQPHIIARNRYDESECCERYMLHINEESECCERYMLHINEESECCERYMLRINEESECCERESECCERYMLHINEESECCERICCGPNRELTLLAHVQ
eukprot:gene5789-60715_t